MIQTGWSTTGSQNNDDVHSIGSDIYLDEYDEVTNLIYLFAVNLIHALPSPIMIIGH